MLTAYPGNFESPKRFVGHACGQVDQTELGVDIDMADVPGIRPRHICNGADDIAGADVVLVLPSMRNRSMLLGGPVWGVRRCGSTLASAGTRQTVSSTLKTWFLLSSQGAC